VASFSFGAGNVAKLVRIPLYLLGRVATLVIPRRPGEWVVGCGAGIGDGALALWQVAVRDGVRPVWIARDDDERREATSHGMPAVVGSSLRGFWATARASVVVVTHGFGDVNRYAISGAFVVQLWHGIPLKRIGLDSPETMRVPASLESLARPASRLLALLYRRTVRRIAIVPAASHLVRGRLESAFGLPDGRVPVTGEPRVDVLSRGTADERRAASRALIEERTGAAAPQTRFVLYAPTWRDGDPDPAIPSDVQWQRLVAMLEETDAVLLIRSHPLGAGEYRPPRTDRVRMLDSAVLTDVTPALSGVDVLVTDYSSLLFDVALIPLPVVYLAPDVVEYTRRRGIYGRYADVTGGEVETDWDGAIQALARVLTDDAERARRAGLSAELSERVHAFRDGQNTERVYRAIRARAGARTQERIPG